MTLAIDASIVDRPERSPLGQRDAAIAERALNAPSLDRPLGATQSRIALTAE